MFFTSYASFLTSISPKIFLSCKFSSLTSSNLYCTKILILDSVPDDLIVIWLLSDPRNNLIPSSGKFFQYLLSYLPAYSFLDLDSIESIYGTLLKQAQILKSEGLPNIKEAIGKG